MIKQLRPYQAEALQNLRLALKKSTHPLLVNASVGAGKSLIIASLLQILERANWRALCLTMNSTLIQQNAETYRDQGGTCGIFCAGLKFRESDKNIIFASPHSIAKSIVNNKHIKNIQFNLIIIDEAHNINPHDRKSMYMRILNHYGLMAQTDQYSFRIVGLTGTPYRGKSISIVGPEQLFKQEVCNISTSWLISQGYLVPPIFKKTNVDSFDMKDIHVDKTGKFKHKDLQEAVDKNKRLTGYIMDEIKYIVESERNGAFIFASTVQHAKECMQNLPLEQSACVTAETPHEERKLILTKAKNGQIKYLINVATLLVGVDVPNFDVCAWLRPTESLVLFTQGIGRVLRLSEGKKDAWILDYAGNLERHGDIDDPIINDALGQKEKDDPDYCIYCSTCNTLNKVTARRCIGIDNEKRCNYYFTFKECDHCGIQNDITARHCRDCLGELIDPNKKLKDSTIMEVQVISASYWVARHIATNTPIINVKYLIKGDTKGSNVMFESFWTSSEKAKNIMYGRFLKQHVDEPSQYYFQCQNIDL